MFAFAIFTLASWLQPKNFNPALQTPVLHDGRRQTLGAGRWCSRRTRRWHPTWLLPLAVTGPSSCPRNQARANISTTSCGWCKLCQCMNLSKNASTTCTYVVYIQILIYILYVIPYYYVLPNLYQILALQTMQHITAKLWTHAVSCFE